MKLRERVVVVLVACTKKLFQTEGIDSRQHGVDSYIHMHACTEGDSYALVSMGLWYDETSFTMHPASFRERQSQTVIKHRVQNPRRVTKPIVNH